MFGCSVKQAAAYVTHSDVSPVSAPQPLGHQRQVRSSSRETFESNRSFSRLRYKLASGAGNKFCGMPDLGRSSSSICHVHEMSEKMMIRNRNVCMDQSNCLSGDWRSAASLAWTAPTRGNSRRTEENSRSI